MISKPKPFRYDTDRTEGCKTAGNKLRRSSDQMEENGRFLKGFFCGVCVMAAVGGLAFAVKDGAVEWLDSLTGKT